MTVNLPGLLAEVEERRKVLDEATAVMNQVLGDAEKALVKLRFGVKASVQVTEHTRLEYSKFDNAWRLVHVEIHASGRQEMIPLLNAPRSARLLAVRMLGPLVIACAAAMTEEITRVEKACEEVERLTAVISLAATKG